MMIGCVDRCVGVAFTSLRPRINSHGRVWSCGLSVFVCRFNRVMRPFSFPLGCCYDLCGSTCEKEGFLVMGVVVCQG